MLTQTATLYHCKVMQSFCTIGLKDTTPPPPCESNTEFPKFDKNNTYCCSDKGVALARGGGVCMLLLAVAIVLLVLLSVVSGITYTRHRLCKLQSNGGHREGPVPGKKKGGK